MSQTTLISASPTVVSSHVLTKFENLLQKHSSMQLMKPYENVIQFARRIDLWYSRIICNICTKYDTEAEENVIAKKYNQFFIKCDRWIKEYQECRSLADTQFSPNILSTTQRNVVKFFIQLANCPSSHTENPIVIPVILANSNIVPKNNPKDVKKCHQKFSLKIRFNNHSKPPLYGQDFLAGIDQTNVFDINKLINSKVFKCLYKQLQNKTTMPFHMRQIFFDNYRCDLNHNENFRQSNSNFDTGAAKTDLPNYFTSFLSSNFARAGIG